jgi:hypothetical protein
MDDIEEWRKVPGYPDYEVSNWGRIKSHRQKPGILKHRYTHTGYDMAALHTVDGMRCDVQVHRLVLMAFVGPCPEDMEACHNDGNTANNWIDNLRWDTHQSNMSERLLSVRCRQGLHDKPNRGMCKPCRNKKQRERRAIKR